MSIYSIQKKQVIESNYKKKLYYYNSARDGLRNILNLNNCKGKTVLLPAYIGYSTREGSGIFDPVEESKLSYVFYNFTSQLEIDSDNLKKLIDNNKAGVLLFVHYFGFKDKNFNSLRRYAIEREYIIIEDCAHAFFTFYNKPDYTSDFILFSLHKMFPFRKGGLLISKEISMITDTKRNYDLLSFDFDGISKKRRGNYLFLKRKIQELNNPNLKILHKRLGVTVPQTMPVLISNSTLRDYLYFELNKRNIGVVSLYHQLIDSVSGFCVVCGLSDTILNLPVHQDISKNEIKYFCQVLSELLS